MRLYTWDWAHPNPTGVIALIHGAGEHCGRYQRVSERFNIYGFAVHGVDLPGHGQSPGKRGHVDAFSEYLDAIDTLLGDVRQRYPNVPVHMLGHSMGGLIAIRYVQTRQAAEQLCSLLLSSPCLSLTLPTPRTKVQIATWIEKLWPTFRSSSGILPKYLSRSTDIVQAAAQDPFMVNRVSIRWYLQLEQAMQEAQTGSAVFPFPVLILQSGNDKVVSSLASKAFADRVVAPDKAYIEYPELYHELLNEPEWERVLADILGWLKRIESGVC